MNMPRNNFEELVAQWLDGRLTEEGSQRLQSELSSSSELRSLFIQYCKLDATLHEIASTTESPDHSALDAILLAGRQQVINATGSDLIAVKEQVALEQESRAQVKTNERENKKLSLRFAFAIAASLLLGFFIAKQPNLLRPNAKQSIPKQSNAKQPIPKQPRAELALADQTDEKKLQGSASVLGEEPTSLHRQPPAPVATLALVEDALWKDLPLKVGQTLLEGESISLVEGNARISVGFGAEIVAEAPFSLTFLSRDRVQLNYGKVGVDVAPWAKGFTVVTEEMNIVDLGTTFTVSASPGQKTETTVLKGLVRVHAANANQNEARGLLVSEGQQVAINRSGLFESVKKTKVNKLIEKFDFGGMMPYRPVDLPNTGLGLSVGDEDQHWRVISGPKQSFGGPQFASVCLPDQRYLPNDPDQSQWISISNWRTAAPNTVYTFQTAFVLDDYDLPTMQLFGRFLGDNGIQEIRVNGKSVPIESWVDNLLQQSFGDPEFRFINITEGLVQGRNVIEVDVNNGMMAVGNKLRAIPNPMALRVEWYAFGRQLSWTTAETNASQASPLRDGYL